MPVRLVIQGRATRAKSVDVGMAFNPVRRDNGLFVWEKSCRLPKKFVSMVLTTIAMGKPMTVVPPVTQGNDDVMGMVWNSVKSMEQVHPNGCRIKLARWVVHKATVRVHRTPIKPMNMVEVIV